MLRSLFIFIILIVHDVGAMGWANICPNLQTKFQLLISDHPWVFSSAEKLKEAHPDIEVTNELCQVAKKLDQLFSMRTYQDDTLYVNNARFAGYTPEGYLFYYKTSWYLNDQAWDVCYEKAIFGYDKADNYAIELLGCLQDVH